MAATDAHFPDDESESELGTGNKGTNVSVIHYPPRRKNRPIPGPPRSGLWSVTLLRQREERKESASRASTTCRIPAA